MKTTKLFMVSVCILAFLALSTSSFAQDKETKKTPEEKAKYTSERLKTSLNLSDEQTAKMYDLNLQRIKDRKEFKENKDKQNSDMKKKRSEYKNSLKTILTDDQMKAMKKMHKEKKMKKQHKHKRHHRV
jgi:methionine-rich copper-binding protein CopC